MKNRILHLILLFLVLGVNAQVLITDFDSSASTVDLNPSAILEIRNTKKGVLFPKVPLNSNTDNVTVPTPVDGVIVQSTTDDRLMFWDNNRWYRNFTLADVVGRQKITTGYVAEQSSRKEVTYFPTQMPLFVLGSNTNGWTDLGVSTKISVNNTNNVIAVDVEGMVSVNNSGSVNFQFAIGVFIDNKLVIVRKFYEVESFSRCMWKKFNLSGIIKNLPVSNTPHTVKVMAFNLPNLSSGNNTYNKITYGDRSIYSFSCTNLNPDMAKTVLSVSVTQ